MSVGRSAPKPWLPALVASIGHLVKTCGRGYVWSLVCCHDCLPVPWRSMSADDASASSKTTSGDCPVCRRLTLPNAEDLLAETQVVCGRLVLDRGLRDGPVEESESLHLFRPVSLSSEGHSVTRCDEPPHFTRLADTVLSTGARCFLRRPNGNERRIVLMFGVGWMEGACGRASLLARCE